MAEFNGEASDPGTALRMMQTCAHTFESMMRSLEQTISNAQTMGVAGDPIATMQDVDSSFEQMKTRCEKAAEHFQEHCNVRDQLAADPALARTQKNTWLRGEAA